MNDTIEYLTCKGCAATFVMVGCVKNHDHRSYCVLCRGAREVGITADDPQAFLDYHLKRTGWDAFKADPDL